MTKTNDEIYEAVTSESQSIKDKLDEMMHCVESHTARHYPDLSPCPHNEDMLRVDPNTGKTYCDCCKLVMS
jgi:hypothetical protein